MQERTLLLEGLVDGRRRKMVELAGIHFSASLLLLPGFIVLKRRGMLVWVGPLGSPIEDAEYDAVVLHPYDLKRLMVALDKQT